MYTQSHLFIIDLLNKAVRYNDLMITYDYLFNIMCNILLLNNIYIVNINSFVMTLKKYLYRINIINKYIYYLI